MQEHLLPIVGIGASAGGLDSLKGFFKNLPADAGAAYIVIQHLDPKHESLTAEILARETSMPCVQITDELKVEANRIHVIPPNAYLKLDGLTLRLSKPVLVHGLRMPIDAFFWSLSEQHEDRAIAIVLSGTGSDGTLGVRAVKGNGGLVLAEDPESAQYDSMPRNAIATGLVDFVCGAEKMPAHLVQFLRHPYIIQNGHQGGGEVATGQDLEEATDAAGMNSIMALLLTRVGQDFRVYKPGMLKRRVIRRMGINHVSSIADYLAFLRGHQDESKRLYKDLLIGVTAFFRDDDAFDALATQVIAPLVESKGTDEPIRIWVPACSSGEEAYSIAMLVTEALDAAQKHCPLQIFATDVDEMTLAMARTGVYPENIGSQLSPARLKRFFLREDHNYRVNPTLRESITFAAQNLIGDPPFSNIDLISCRNLLIYLNNDIQRKVLALFHFALREGGFLFLGHSETTSKQDSLFVPVSGKWRIYRRAKVLRPPPFAFPIGAMRTRSTGGRAAEAAEVTPYSRLDEITQRYLLQEFAPAAVLIDSKHQILYFSGPTSRYLEQPTGLPTQELLGLVRQEIRPKLRAVLRRVAQENHRIVVDDVHMTRDGARVRVKLTLTHLNLPRRADRLLLITFEDLPEPAVAPQTGVVVSGSSDADALQHLEFELNATREELQTNIEELESANEELQAANEEVMSVNEELQSANEELETSKEELQSMNEELATTNSQLKDKMDELAHTNDDLANLLTSTDIATLFLDRHLNIGRFTPATKPLLSLIDSDVGRPLTDIRPKFTDAQLLDDAQRVLDKLAPVETEINTPDGACYLRRILPYRTRDNRIAGVVVTFIDITVRKAAEQQSERLALVVRDSNDAVLMLDRQGKIIAWNRGAANMYGWTEAEALTMNMRDLAQREEQQSTVELMQRIAEGESITGIEAKRTTKDGRLIEVWLTVTPLRDATGDVYAVATTERDVTERNAVANELRRSAANFRALVESAPDTMVICTNDGIIASINQKAEMLFGYSRNELVGLPVETLIAESRRMKHVKHRQHFILSAQSRPMGTGLDLFATNKQGKTIPIEVNLSPVELDNTQHVCASIRDISDRKRAEEVIRHAKAEADAANATKSRFLTMASHDLRQPLHSLKLLNATLLRIVSNAKARTILSMQDDALSSMSRLLNALLDVSILDSGTIEPHCADTALQPIFERMQAEFEADAAGKGLELKIEATDSTLWTDPNLLSQLLQNLVANAIRYTKEGFVQLRAVPDGSGVRIEVADSGIGIPDAEVGRIFDEFHQVHHDETAPQKGFGLGLSIVQRIAHLLGSKVEVVTEVGRGSVFSFVQPTGSAARAEPSPNSGGTERILNVSGKILLIDDDPAVLDATQMFLAMEDGFEILAAASPAEAFAILEEQTPDLIISDFHLHHHHSGVDIIRAARERSGRLIPAILISGDTSPSLSNLGIDAVHVLTKPINVDELVELSRGLLQSGQEKD